jgi:hypothetical protein
LDQLAARQVFAQVKGGRNQAEHDQSAGDKYDKHGFFAAHGAATPAGVLLEPGGATSGAAPALAPLLDPLLLLVAAAVADGGRMRGVTNTTSSV